MSFINKYFKKIYPFNDRSLSAPSFKDGTISRDDLLKEGFKRELFDHGFIVYLFAVLMGFTPIFFIIPLVSIYVLFKDAKINLLKDVTYFYIIERKNWFKRTKYYSTAVIKATKNERLIYFTKGCINLVIICFIIYSQYMAYWNTNNDIKSGKIVQLIHKKAIVNVKNGLKLRKSYSSDSESICPILFQDTIEIINDTSIQCISGSKSKWIQVRYHENSGWVWNEYIQEIN